MRTWVTGGDKPGDAADPSDRPPEVDAVDSESVVAVDAFGHATTDGSRLLEIDSDISENPPTCSPPTATENSSREPTDAEKLLRLDESDSAGIGLAVAASLETETDIAGADQSSATSPVHGSVETDLPVASVESVAALDADTDAVRTRILADAAARAEQHLEEVCGIYGVEDPRDVAHVAQARDVIAETLAPLVVEGACRMLPVLHAEIAEHPNKVYPVVNRDGTPVGLVIEQLDPDLFDAHCRPVHISRKTSEEALQDEEKHAGRSFPQLGEDLRDRGRADPEEIPGAAMRLERHLLRSGVDITTPDVQIGIIDSGHKGSIQEALAARYPGATFSGHYLFYTQSEEDPHPTSKTGHLLHISAERVFPVDPDDPARIFADKDPSFVYEQILHGPRSTTIGYDDRGRPIQSFESPPTGQIDPLLIAERYSRPDVRAAIAEIAQHAVADCARTVADLDSAGLDYRPSLTDQADSCIRKIRDWAYGHDTGDPEFNALADSFVRCEDKHLVARLREAVTALGFGDAGTDARTDAVWHGYQNLHPDDKSRYVEQLERSTASSSAPSTPEGTPHG